MAGPFRFRLINSEGGPVIIKTEQQTRRDLINPALEKAGWSLRDRTRVVEEVDTKQSNFLTRDYKTVDETLRNDADSEYVDYLLLDAAHQPRSR